jgi:4-oxalocrotonate tautomerase
LKNRRRRIVPHVVGKLWPGKSEQQKIRLAEEIVKGLMAVLNYGEESVSVAIEEVKPQDWAENGYKADTVKARDEPYKKPGYNPSNDVRPTSTTGDFA